VEQEEAGEAEVADHPELLLEAHAGVLAAAVAWRVALLQAHAAELRQVAVGLRALRAGVAISQVLRQVEGDALRHPAGLLHSLRVIGEAEPHLIRRRQRVRGVAAALGLALVEGLAQPHRHQRVLEGCALARVRVDVARCNRGHPQPLRQLGEQAVAAEVAAGEGALELHPQAVGAEDPEQLLAGGHRSGRRGAVARRRPFHRRCKHAVARATGETDQALGMVLHVGERDAGGKRLPASTSLSRALVRAGDQPAEVAVAGAVPAQEGEVAPVVQREFRARDGHQAQRLRGLRELHRAVQAVVVGQGDRGVALLGGRDCELLRQRGAVEEGVGGVAVQFGVGHRA
jgi:hypothetical protein